MYNKGDCFLVLGPHCATGTLIFGRNAEATKSNSTGVAQEVQFYAASEAAKGSELVQIDNDVDDTLAIILQKPRPEVWGGDYGANERNVCIGISWTEESDSCNIRSTDVLRLALATSKSALAAVERIGALLLAHGPDDAKYSFVICDANEAFLLSSGGKLWAAYKATDGHLRLPNDGLAVTTTIDKSSEALGDALKALGLWNGEGELNFAVCLNAAAKETVVWSGVEPVGDGGYGLTSMFATLRSATKTECSRSSSVSVLNANGISVHWFTATPNASESVFKPFVFAPNAKISPLTRVQSGGGSGGDDCEITLLHKLHAQRKPAAVADLQALEEACVQELEDYLSEHPVVDEELDELMKDCVEAEVKFYR